MSRFSFTLADENDDALLRERMSQDHMEGSVSVSFRREPSYFTGAGVQGETIQVIKCTDKTNGKLVGLGARMTLFVFINGVKQRMGYLSDLRGAPEYRKGTLLARGYQYLRQLHEDDSVTLYSSVILEGNKLALENISGGRAGLPIYKNIGKVLTPAIHLDIKRKPFTISGLSINTADKESLDEVFTFIQREYAGKQFAPFYQATDMDGARLKGLRPEDIYVAKKEDKIVGIIAAWDQREFRQTHIEGYSKSLKMIRPIYNLLAKFSPLKPLPNEGESVPYFYLALTAIYKDKPEVFKTLLSRLYEDKRKGQWHYFIAGLHEQHPLSQVLNEFRSIKAAGHLFIVHYPQDETFFEQLDERVPHVEIGAI